MPWPCTASSGMTRWNTVSLGTTVGRLGLVADALIIGSPAPWRSGSTALVSPEKAGPMMPMIELSLTNLSFSVDACAGSPAVSNSLSVTLTFGFPALYWSTASLAPLRMLMPRLALSPVSAPTKPSATVFPPLAELHEDLLLPQAQRTRAPAASGATTYLRRG